MATEPTAAPAAEGASAPAMWKITLSRSVELLGFDYNRGREHTVDDATLAALGDAVQSKKAA